MDRYVYMVACLLFFPVVSNAQQMFVKKSDSEYCHYISSPYYEKTLSFTPYPNLKVCLDSGGDIPPNTALDGILPPVKFSRNAICHDSSSDFYGKTKRYVSFKTIDECLAQGGRLPNSYVQKKLATTNQ